MADPRHRPDEVAARSFPTTFRGFDPSEVRSYLASVAAALSAAAEREASLREDLARARMTLAHPEIDETVLMAALGDETTKVLVAARAAANDIRVSADDNAAETLARAHEEAEQLRTEARAAADDVIRDAEGMLAVRTREADDAAAELMLAAGEEAERIRAAGLEEARALVREARSVRERMLEDLRGRVRRGEASFAALQLGRDRVLEALGSVRDALDTATHGLATAEAGARADAVAVAALAGDAGAARVDAFALTLPEPGLPSMGERIRSDAEVRLSVRPVPTDEAEVPEEPEEDERLVHTGEPSGPVAAVVPIGAVFQENVEEELTPTYDTPSAAPTTGEVPVIAATGTDTYSSDRGRRTRRSFRLAGEPAVRAEEQRLASMRYLHRPRTGSEPDVHLPEDGMVVVEPPSAGEAVRILGRVAPPSPRRPPPPPSHHGGPDEPGVTVLGPVSLSDLPTRRPPGAAAPASPPPSAGPDDATVDEAVSLSGDMDEVEPNLDGPEADVTAAPEPTAEAGPAVGADAGPVVGEAGDKVSEAVAEAEDVVTASSEPVDPEIAPAPGDVDALFAKLRASRAEPEIVGATPTAPAAVQESPAAPVEAVAAFDTETSEEPGDEAALQQRDMATGPLETQLAKMVKRLLQDHQNSVLDKLRAKRRPAALELLGGVEDLVRPLAAAAEPLLARAVAAGFSALAPAGKCGTPPAAADLAGDIAANVVRDLRPRLEAAFAHDDDEVPEAVNVAFREWRGERVSRLVGDALHVAYIRGGYVALPKGARLRWVADDGEQPCPDCEDNALAVGMRKGKAFPTGHRHPPAHTACRCIIVRS